ncbi:MAG: transporter associated domain-containing protein, partial [Ghiorsea sp.]|nr:transporter associated domain-containing protein [Ghiorsea sp.]
MLDAGKTVEACVEDAIGHPHSRYPVYHGDHDNILGVVHLRDLLKIRQSETPLSSALIWTNPAYAPTNRNALAQLFEFQSKHLHMAIVVDEFGDIEGVITLEDIVEEIVGEIVDESDVIPPTDVWVQPDGSWVVDNTANIHDLNQLIGSEMPENGATTIGGLIVEELGGVPDGKLCLQVDSVRIEVLKIKNKRIQRLRLTRHAEEASGVFITGV